MNAGGNATPLSRIGVRRLIPSREYPHLRRWALMRIGGGVALATCGLLTLSFGGNDAKTYGWAGMFLGLAALNLAAGSWELTVARSLSPRD